MSSSSVVSEVISSSLSTSSNSLSLVSCTDAECSVTMGGSGTTVGVFGTTIAFGGISNGTATLRVGDQDVSFSKGQTVTPGSLKLTCTDVTGDTVSFTAAPR